MMSLMDCGKKLVSMPKTSSRASSESKTKAGHSWAKTEAGRRRRRATTLGASIVHRCMVCWRLWVGCAAMVKSEHIQFRREGKKPLRARPTALAATASPNRPFSVTERGAQRQNVFSVAPCMCIAICKSSKGKSIGKRTSGMNNAQWNQDKSGLRMAFVHITFCRV